MNALARANARKPVWINETSKPGPIQVDGQTYVIGAHQYPRNERAEQDVLSCILRLGDQGRGREALERIPDLHWDDFYFKANAAIFRGMERCYQSGQEIDLDRLVTLLQEVPKGGQSFLDFVGGERYLLALKNRSGMNLEDYALDVIRASLGRSAMFSADQLAEIGKRVNQMSLAEIRDAVPTATRDLTVRMHMVSEQNTYNLYDAIDDYRDTIRAELEEKKQPAISTGFHSLDKVIIGWRKKKLYICAAPPGWGKTAFAICAALNLLKQGLRVLFVSLEMERDELLERMICVIGQIDYTAYQKREWTDEDVARFERSTETLKGYTTSKQFMMAIFEAPTLTQIQSKLTEIDLSTGFDLVIVDYVGPDTISGFRGDFEAASAFYKALKGWKKHYDIPILAFAQMNQKWDARKGKLPGLTDLYYGSAGRAAADAIWYIHHESMVSEDPSTMDAQLLFRKNRAGRGGSNVVAYLGWEPTYQTFYSDAPPTQKPIQFGRFGDSK